MTVLEERVNEVGNLRVRCARGWTSVTNRADGQLVCTVTFHHCFRFSNSHLSIRSAVTVQFGSIVATA
eukprot:SAG31_NODE_1051_length_10157_cov_203.009048_6_plen_68_part_00